MNFLFHFLLFIVAISVFSIVLVDSITGDVTFPSCGPNHPFELYHNTQDMQRAVNEWRAAGFVPLSYQTAPRQLQEEGYSGYVCFRRRTVADLNPRYWPKEPNMRYGLSGYGAFVVVHG